MLKKIRAALDFAQRNYRNADGWGASRWSTTGSCGFFL